MRLTGLGPESWGERKQAGGMEQDGGKEQDGGILFTLSEQGGRPGAPHMVLKRKVVDWDSDLQSAPGMLGVWGFPPCLPSVGKAQGRAGGRPRTSSMEMAGKAKRGLGSSGEKAPRPVAWKS